MKNHSHIVYYFLNIKKYFVLCLVITLHFITISAQTIETSSQLNKNLIRIGEQTELILKVKYNNKEVSKVLFPKINDTLIKGIEVISKSEVEKYTPDNNNPSVTEQKQTIVITGFDSGYYALPPFKFIVNDDTSKVSETEALLIQIQTVDADTSKPIKDIKQPLDAPFSFNEAIPYIIGIAGVVAALLVLYYLYEKNKKKPIYTKPKLPETPPHEIALKELEKIKSEKLWQDGKLKLYYSAITDVLRIYIEKTLPINAMELTTDEILYRFRKININRETKDKLKQTLLLADMVKFAKEIPLADENELALTNAIEFVKETTMDKSNAKQEETNLKKND